MKRFSREMKIGSAFLFSIVLLYVGVNFLKGNNVFSKDHTYYTVVGNAGGVVPSSVVTTNGYQVGTVTRVAYDFAHPNRIVLTLRVRESLRVPKGSRALLVNSLLGGVSVELKLSQAEEFYADGDTIASGVASGLTDEIENVMLPQVNALIPKVDSLISALTALVANPALTHSLNNVESLTHKLNHTAVELDQLFYKELPQLLGSLQGASDNVKGITDNLKTFDYAQTLSRVDSVVTNLQTISTAMTSGDSSIGLLLNDTAFYSNLNGVCSNVNALIEDVKAHPSRYINISVFGKKSNN